MPGWEMTRRALLGSTMLALAAPAFAGQRLPYRNSAAPVSVRVQDLLSRMTLREKCAQLRSMWFGKAAIMDADGRFSASAAIKSIPDGIGQIARPHDTAGMKAFRDDRFREFGDTVQWINALQRYLVEHTRLGIPALLHEEAAHGYLAKDATVFPSPPALGSTWDPDLVERVYGTAAREMRVRGATIALAPVIDLARDPRYGRVEEFYGEDPYHVGQMGVAAVRGLQGRSRPLGRDKVFATLKHFVHAVPQGGLNLAPAHVGEREMREAYVVPFAEVIRKTDPAVIMPSYNEVDGVPSHADADLLLGHGRALLGFKGVYMSDYGGVSKLATQHHVAESEAQAAVLALKAGVQADLPDGVAFMKLPELVEAGKVPVATIDNAVAQILALKFEAGLFENPYVDAAFARRVTNTPAAIELAREAAEKAIVLLKNDGIAPVEGGQGVKLAVIGPNALDPLFGGYSGINARAVGILDGIRKHAPKGTAIEYARGVQLPASSMQKVETPQPLDPDIDRRLIAEAVAVATRSDVVVLVLGDVPEITREAVDYPLPGDRRTLGLWGRQDELVEAMIASGKPIIALLLNGRALTVNRLAEKANAVFEGWYLGEEGGNAFARVLFGAVNPGGKLAVSFPASVGDLPVYYNGHPTADLNQYVEGPRATLFPFGHGLSYTSFEIGAPLLARSNIGVGDTVQIGVEVANTGKRRGDEIVQLYLRDEVSSAPRPVLELRRFERITLEAGERRTVQFALTSEDLAFWDADMKWTVEPGTFRIHVGTSSASTKSVILTVG